MRDLSVAESSGRVPNWNFWKYLVDPGGHVVNAWGPMTSPDRLYSAIRNEVDKVLSLISAKDRMQDEL